MKINNMIRPDLKDIKPYSSARDEYKGKEGIYLDANENPFDNGVNRYPDPLQLELKRKVAQIKSVKEDEVFFGNGSDECIDLLIRLFCVPKKDEVVMLSPSYGMYDVSAKINQVKTIQVSLNKDFTLDIAKLLKKGENAKIMFICSPNNPTGNAFSKKEIISILKKFNGIVVVDEAYVDFSKEGTMLTELNKYKNLIVTQTFSKAYGMAGLRLGILFASSEIIAWLNKIKPPYNINQLTQIEALKRLENLDEVQNQIKTILVERIRLETKLIQFDEVERVYNSDSNFILLKVKSADDVYNYLIENKIIVRNRNKQPLCDNCIRITVGTKKENDFLLKKLKEFSIK